MPPTASSTTPDYSDDDIDSLHYRPEQKTDGLNSPTDVRSYRHRNERAHEDNDDDVEEEEEYDEDLGGGFDSSLARLGDLPIVREGSTLSGEVDNMLLMNGRGFGSSEYDDDDDSEYDEEVRNQYFEYQREQEELQREMNLNKIAFAAYRGAVLHLVHNQASFGKIQRSNRDEKKELDGDEVGGGESMNQSKSNDTDADTVNTEEDANQRMTILEEMAKEIIETKARACFDAVLVVKEFEERREERRKRQRLLVGGFASLGSQENVLSELRKKKKDVTEKANLDESPKVEKETSITKEMSKSNNSVKKPIVSKPTPAMKKDVVPVKKVAAPSGPLVPLKKKSTRHVDCVKSTLPKFSFEKDCHENDNSNNNNNGSTPASYGTTKWITNMVQWKIQKRKHEESTRRKCGCPDCLKELQSLKQ